MIPSVVVDEIRSALIEFLTSTFALTDDDAREALAEFLQDDAEGIFRGPYLRVRTPFRQVDNSWTSPLDWSPSWFTPYQHQATAFERLSTAGERIPAPSLVTTGTGSGKTECFLYPVLDHCVRQRALGKPGIKALLLYPMNALASDQAGRIAKLINEEVALSGLTAGIYVGGDGRYSSMGPDNLIDKRSVLRADPPDILLTNYKMLDFLLLRPDDRDLWAANELSTLQYVVLDEFHTYDGAQGTDVAMLLRRLGATLNMAEPGAPLGSATPVATSATLGSSDDALVSMREFAGKVFGTSFDETSIIGETRQTPDEACRATDYRLSIPEPSEVAELTDLDDVYAAFCSTGDEGEPPQLVDAGDVLLSHPLTRAVLSAVGEKPKSWSDTVAEVVSRAPNWGRAMMDEPASVDKALTQFIRLLSIARRKDGALERPLFPIEVQLWIREVSRLLRTVSATPSFRWRDSASALVEDDEATRPEAELPAVYCRRCAASGWMSIVSETTGSFGSNPSTIYKAALQRSPLVRAMLSTNSDDPEAVWYSPSSRIVMAEPDENCLPVLMTLDEDAARDHTCPACGEKNTIRFLGTAVASLASVAINTLFASPNLEENERKLIAFTDSVQDASHRASFFGGRTHRINLRSLMAGIVAREEEVELADLGDILLAESGSLRDRFGLIPPDLLQHQGIATTWTDSPKPESLELLSSRLGFEVDLEFGLRSRVGRTLELSQACVATVEIDDFDSIVDLVREDIEAQTGIRVEVDSVSVYLRGILERMRLKGGLLHPLLDRYLEDNGRLWSIWGGRPDGLPPFTSEQSRPLFFTTANKSEFDSLTALSKTPTWIVDWGTRTLGLTAKQVRDVNLRALTIFASESEGVVEHKAGNARIYGIDRRSILIRDLPDHEAVEASLLRCSMCGQVHVVDPNQLDLWLETSCLRYRCVGKYSLSRATHQTYYRDLYRSGQTRRVVTGEHTGLLGRAAREDLEKRFKEGVAPDAPNVITATPTLELGIDIGDLSAVMLTSVPRNPASYIQRVGRSGRLTGNSLVTTFVRTDTHSLYYLAEPEAMLAGEIRSPNCYLDAIETLQRQFIAYLIDRIAAGDIDGPLLPDAASVIFKDGAGEQKFLGAVVTAAESGPEHVERFLGLFAEHLATASREKLVEFSANGVRAEIDLAVATFARRVEQLSTHRNRLKAAIDRFEANQTSQQLTNDEAAELRDLRGQRAQIIKLLRDTRKEYSLSALGRLGLLPNYNMLDETVTLTASLWSRNDDDEIFTTNDEYERSARFALSELAPGNSFYVGGHRHLIDAINIGPPEAPLTEEWRLCPDCDFARLDIETEDATVCPRCRSAGFADTGARFKMLRLAEVYASGSEESARVYDEADERRRANFEIVTLVDVEPAHIEGAWALPDKAFGAEMAARTHIRTINLGPVETRGGETRSIGGIDHRVTAYEVCSHCGAVAGTRDDHHGQNPERLHQGWCKVRSGSVAEASEQLVLFHELTTEAVRLLLPVSMFEVEERLASFKGALLLGLREDFGGEPDHLEVILADAPNRSGEGRKRFLVLFDSVPGGTGYLARLGDSDRVKSILEKGRRVISRCRCIGEGRQACHRCLLGVVDRRDYDLVRRDLSLEILDDLLANWHPESVDTVGDLDIGLVEESELERRFKVALREWANQNPEIATFRTVPSTDPRYAAFELLFHQGESVVRYRIQEQEGLSTTPSVRPDFVIERQDEHAPKIAIFLDGYQFHASPDINNIATDANKRRGIRDAGMLVWNLVWQDVQDFHDAVKADPPRPPKKRPLLTGGARANARKAHHSMPRFIDFDAVNQNPFEMLLIFLANPDLDEWAQLANSAVLGVIANSDTKGSVDVAGAGLLASEAVRCEVGELPIATDEAIAFAGRHVSANDLALVAMMDTREGFQNDDRWTVIASLPDSDHDVSQPGHRERWHDWLQWANILQFVRGPGREIIISGVSDAAGAGAEDLLIVAPPAVVRDSESLTEVVALSDEMEDELALLIDEEAAEMTRSALLAGAKDFVAGKEIDGHVIEVAWEGAKVGILGADVEELSVPGWDLRFVGDWEIVELVGAIQERS